MAAHPAGSAGPGPGGMQQFAGGGTPTDPQDVLQALITETMLDDEAMKFIPKLDEGEVDRYVQNVEERNHLTDEQLRAQLQSQGVSYDAFRSNVRRQVATMTMIDREVRQKIVIPDSEIQAYYKDHPDEFTVTDEHYRLAQILIALPAGATPDQVAAAQKKAEDIRKQAVNGANFGDLARQYSDDDSKSKGGQLGVFTPNDLNDDIAKAIAPLKDGDVSPVVRTKYGFHIVKVEEHEKPGLQPARRRQEHYSRQADDRAGQSKIPGLDRSGFEAASPGRDVGLRLWIGIANRRHLRLRHWSRWQY